MLGGRIEAGRLEDQAGCTLNEAIRRTIFFGLACAAEHDLAHEPHVASAAVALKHISTIDRARLKHPGKVLTKLEREAVKLCIRNGSNGKGGALGLYVEGHGRKLRVASGGSR